MGKGKPGGRNCTDNGQVDVQGMGLRSYCQECGLTITGAEKQGMFLSREGTRSRLNLREVSGSLCKMEEFPKGVERPLWDPEHEEMKLEIAGKSELSCRE